MLVQTRSEEMHARWRAWRTLVERRDAIVDGTEGRWLHAWIEKHPALELPERTRRR